MSAYFRALRRADVALRASPGAHLPLWARNVPPDLCGEYAYRAFGLGALLFFEPYSREEFADAIALAETLNLAGHIRDRQFDQLVTPVSV